MIIAEAQVIINTSANPISLTIKRHVSLQFAMMAMHSTD